MMDEILNGLRVDVDVKTIKFYKELMEKCG